MKTVGRLILFLLGVVALLIGGLETSAGKRLVARAVERAVSGALAGRLSIGSLRGNLVTGFTASKIKVLDARGRTALRIANVSASYRLRLKPLQLRIIHVTLEQPRLLSDSPGSLLKPSEGPPPEERAAAASRPLVWIQRVRVVEGAFGSVSPINADLALPESFDRLPEGRIFAGGRFRGLPVKLVASIRREEGALTAPGRLSGVAKREAPQSLAMVGALGRSRLEATGSGSFNPRRLADSDGRLTVQTLHLEPAELRLPLRQPLDGRAEASLSGGAARAAVDVKTGTTAELVARAAVEDVSHPEALLLERLALSGRCRLLELQNAPRRIELAAPAPLGRLRFSGCAGNLSYINEMGRGLALNVSGLELGALAEALGFRAPGADGLGKLDAIVGLPRGPLVPQGSVRADWSGGAHGESVHARARLDRGVLQAQVSGELASSRVTLDGTVKRLVAPERWELRPGQAQGTVTVASKDVELARLAEAGFLPQGLTGKANLEGRAELRGERMKTHLELTGRGLSVKALKTPVELKASATYDGHQLLADAAAVAPAAMGAGGEGTVRLRTAMALPLTRLKREGVAALASAPLDWQLETRRLNLAAVLRSLEEPMVTERPELFASVRGAGKGTVRSPEARAEVLLETPKGRLAELTAVVAGERLTADLTSRAAVIDPLFPLFTDFVRTENGRFDADFHVDGPIAQPRARGFIRLQAAGLRLPPLGTRYENVAVELEGGEGRIALKQLSARSGNGSLSAVGVLALTRAEAPRALTFNARFNDFEALASEQADVRVDGNLALAASRADSSFEGTLNLDSGRVLLPEGKRKRTEPLGDLEDVTIGPVAGAQGHEPGGGLFENLHGTVKIHAPGRFWVDNRDKSIAIELKADLAVGWGEDSEPFIRGAVIPVRGNAELFGRRFELRPSEVDFTGDPSAPHISAEAYYAASPWSILVTVIGDPKTLKPVLSSDPPGLSQEECLSVLLTGDPNAQSNKGGGRSASSVAAGAATGFLMGKLKSELGSRLPIDTFSADIATDRPAQAAPSYGAGGQEEGRSKIEVGKYLSDRIFMKFGHVFSAEDQAAIDKLTLTYRLSNRWSIETTQTDQGRSELQILWTQNY